MAGGARCGGAAPPPPGGGGGAHEPGRPADTRGTRRRRASYVDNKFEAVNGEDAARVGHADVGAGWPVRTGRGPRGKGGRRAT